MTYQVLAALLAEGGVIDMRGMGSILGILGDRITAPSLPTNLAPTFCLVAEEPDSSSVPNGGIISISAEVTGPDGAILFGQHQQSPLVVDDAGKAPHRIQAVFTVPVRASEYGEYTFTLRLDVPKREGAPEHIEVARTIRLDKA